MEIRLIGAVGALSMFVCACGVQPTARDIRAGDRECELVVSQQLHSVLDLWERRFGVTVWCRSAGIQSPQSGSVQQVGEITVTVSPANGQSATSQASLESAEDTLTSTLEGIVKREGWETQYPRRVLQAIP